MLKLADNPPLAFPHESLLELRGQWWVGHTKSRAEKALAWDLSRRGISYFLPLVKRVAIYGGKRRSILLPVFPSYVFFCGDEEARYKALLTDRLCQVLTVPDQQTLIEELIAVQKVLKYGEADPYLSIPMGSQCRVTGGPLSGIEGTVVRRDGQQRLVLQVSMLGQGIAVEVDSYLLERL